MALIYTGNVAAFDGAVSVEEAEGLLQWIQENPQAQADFSDCTHVHAASLQVLMAAAIPVTAWPPDAQFAAWLAAALHQ